MTRESEMIAAIADTLVKYLADTGELNGNLRVTYDMHTAARRVVWASHYYGGQTGVNLKAAIDALEKIVGRPDRESDI